ncbi:hypothetical protein GCM10028805_52180 [Spirosoma harenae]
MVKSISQLLRIICHRPRRLVPLADIVWVEGQGPYSLIHFQNGTSLKVAIPIAGMASRLPELVRTHRGQLVNLVHVKHLERLPNAMVLSTGVSLPVARRRWLQVQWGFLDHRTKRTLD